MYDRTYIDGERRDKIINGSIKETNIWGLNKSENIELYMVAMALGYDAGNKEKSEHRIGYILNTAVQNSYPEAVSFMNAIHLYNMMQNGEEIIDIDDVDVAYDLGEQFVNAGLDIIDEEAQSGDDEAMVFSALRKLDKKFSEVGID